MNWIHLQSIDQLGLIQNESHKNPVLIFKHSASCSTSQLALNRLERNWKEIHPVKAYFLNLTGHRDISSQIENTYQVQHESPQILIIRRGGAVFHRSHLDIEWETIRQFLMIDHSKN